MANYLAKTLQSLKLIYFVKVIIYTLERWEKRNEKIYFWYTWGVSSA